jgi:Dolichyl-phosphate-mannose-protein mannosyltransferase
MTSRADAPTIAADAQAPAIFIPWWSTTSRDDRARAIFALTWIATVAYLATWIAHGWIPHDDGLLAQSAERFLRGQLPHRDFDDMYTGGLTMLHGAAFAVLGTRLLSLRLELLVAAALWVPIVYAIARRFATPALAALATLAAVVWSVPNYSAAMPSWYNLFFATAGLLALLKYAETGRSRWLVAAGVAGGLSVLIKIVGLYFLAGAGLFVVYRACRPAIDPERKDGDGTVSPVQGAPRLRSVDSTSWDRWTGLGVAVAATLLILTAIAALLRPAAGSARYFYFLLPTAATCVGLIVQAWTGEWFSWREFWQGAGALAGGAALVVVPFVAAYAQAHALGSLYTGLLVLPMRRFSFAMGYPTWPGAISIALAAAVLVTLPIRPRLVGALIGAAVLGMLAHPWNPQVRQLWDSRIVEAARTMPTILACGFASLVVAQRCTSDSAHRAQAFAVMAVASPWVLVEYPFFGLIYFFYVVPLVVLAAVALFSVFGQPGGKLSGSAVLALFTLFAIQRMPPHSGALMTTGRGGIVVSAPDSAEAQMLVDVVRAHSHSQYTFATPDCPEVYFLTGLSNPTRTMYDFFDDTTGRTDRLLRMLNERQITVVTIDRNPLFSGPPDPRFLAALVARYPDSATVGRYTVRWQADDRIAASAAGAPTRFRAPITASHARASRSGLE